MTTGITNLRRARLAKTGHCEDVDREVTLEKRSGVVHATESISTLIPQARRERGLTQEELARRLSEISRNDSITREDISRWERGKRIPGPYWRGWISKALEMPCDDVERAALVARTTRREHRQLR